MENNSDNIEDKQFLSKKEHENLKGVNSILNNLITKSGNNIAQRDILIEYDILKTPKNKGMVEVKYH